MRKIWTFETCKIDALRFHTRTEWQKNNRSAYCAAHKNKWLDECCGHMKYVKLPNNYWTLEKCIEEAKKYATKSVWATKSSGSYNCAHKNDWLEKCCQHMESSRHLKGYWTLEVCKLDALSYTTRDDWFNAKSGGYSAAHRKGWLDECCGHMIELSKPDGYWTLEKCIEDANKYINRGSWKRASCSAYAIACKNKWLGECCTHMNKSSGISIPECNLMSFIKEKFDNAIHIRVTTKNFFKNKPHIHSFELDIYIPELRKAIEFNGDYWHSI